MKKSPISQFPDYTNDLKEVINSEKEYIYQRRLHHNQIRKNDTDSHIEDPWGIAISGGGIRSATLGLGMIQKFIVEGIFKRFDYMSTVSGGGFIASCLTSLMNTDSDKFVHPDHLTEEEAQKQIPGLDIYTSPLVLLMETREREAKADAISEDVIKGSNSNTRWAPSQMISDKDEKAKKEAPLEVMIDYTSSDKTRIDARHQVHHLRTHGEYLTPDKSIFSVSIQRLVGTFFAGFFHNFTLFLLGLLAFVTLNYIVFDMVSSGDFYNQVTKYHPPTGGEPVEITDQLTEQITNIWTNNLSVFISDIGNLLGEHPSVIIYLVILGFVLGIIAIISKRALTKRIDNMQEQIHSGGEPSSLSGLNQAEYEESNFLKKFNFIAILGAPIIAILTWIIGLENNYFAQDQFWIIFGLPVCMAFGIFIAVYFVLPFFSTTRKQTRFERSFDGALRGATLYSLILSVIIPFSILLIFTFSFLFNEIFVTITSSLSSLVSIGVGYFAMSSKPSEEGGIVSSIVDKLKIPAISLSVVLFIGLMASAITGLLARSGSWFNSEIYLPGWLFLAALLLFLIVGSFINANKMSLHYFYRDRLSEAYLKTDGRIIREKRDMQGKPLVNLRDSEDLRLMDLGWKRVEKETDQTKSYRVDDEGGVWESNARGPYHLVVSALNLQGSNELVRKDLKSEHFVFSRNYIGAHSTGYVKTDVYRDGKTELARAMTISGAAVGSGMGMISFFAQSFLTTILNLRLGYWMENPWYYRQNCNEVSTNSWFAYQWKKIQGWEDVEDSESGKYTIKKNPDKKYTFWPAYLIKELFATSDANSRLVNLSDGGHTGDNLGLIPLLQRRCKTIVVCDFEADPKFTFESFNHAVRIANIEENVDIDIDLRPLIPHNLEDGKVTNSNRSVMIGKIGYPDMTYGTLVYIKSSLNQDKLPISSFNYHTKQQDFPHQSTADQFFDDTQFEAYRALGFHMAGQAAREIQRVEEQR